MHQCDARVCVTSIVRFESAIMFCRSTSRLPKMGSAQPVSRPVAVIV